MHSGYVYKIHLKRALPATATNHSLFLGIIQVVSMGCSMKPLVSLCGIIFQCWHFKWSTFWFQYNYWLMHFWEPVLVSVPPAPRLSRKQLLCRKHPEWHRAVFWHWDDYPHLGLHIYRDWSDLLVENLWDMWDMCGTSECIWKDSQMGKV